MGSDNGCCSSLARFFLFLINGLFLLMGLVLFILAAVLKWTDWIEGFSIKELDSLTTFGAINTVPIVVMVIAGFMIVLSAIGIIAALSLNKCFLFIYEVLLILIFLVHGVSLLVLVFTKDTIEKEYLNYLNITAPKISKENRECDLFKALSLSFDCCGAEYGYNSFYNRTVANDCCAANRTDIGCGKLSIEFIESHATNLVIIPSGAILVVELFAIIAIPVLMSRKK